jgi:hypothetical protein
MTKESLIKRLETTCFGLDPIDPLRLLVDDVIEALRENAMREVQRLGQEIEQEPVALPCCGYADASAVKWNPHNQVVQCHNCGQVYETPQQRTWVGLTDEEMTHTNHHMVEGAYQYSFKQGAKWAESKLKERNT